MRGEPAESDILPASRCGGVLEGWEVLGDGIIKVDAAPDEDSIGNDLGDGADQVLGVPVDRLCSVHIGGSQMMVFPERYAGLGLV